MSVSAPCGEERLSLRIGFRVTGTMRYSLLLAIVGRRGFPGGRCNTASDQLET
jgi:hypothetical protein